jgi:tRNA-Thr(GGU) m(6)t(6)A37 methyltransferase TsaA
VTVSTGIGPSLPLLPDGVAGDGPERLPGWENQSGPRRTRRDKEMNAASLSFNPIGRVENGLPLGTPGDTLRASESHIVIDPEFLPGLDDLEKETRILVVFHFHLSRDYELHQHPRGDTARPKRGVFALRSPRRPNPIGVTEVTLLEIRGNVLRVKGLDAVDGTPVLDLKPA